MISNAENHDCGGSKQKIEFDNPAAREKLGETSNHSDSENSVKSMKVVKLSLFGVTLFVGLLRISTSHTRFFNLSSISLECV